MIYIFSNNLNIFKPLKDLNLINSFLFDSSMEDPQNAKKIAQIIIKRTTGRIVDNIIVETQKELKGTEPGQRGIRMDVLVSATDSENIIKEVYDIEPNDYHEPDLAKRTRYYNSLIDSKLLKSNEHFKCLPELISIWILTYDPFGENRMLYTVKNTVAENHNLVYNDGVTNLFLYTGGSIGGSKDLSSLLKHIVHTTKANAVDEDLKQIQNIVDAIKRDKKVGERYMSMEKIYESTKQRFYEMGKEAGLCDGLEEGRKTGLEEGIKAFIEAFQETGLPLREIKIKLLSKFDISETTLDEYIKKYFK